MDTVEVQFKFKVGDIVVPVMVQHLLDDTQETWLDRPDVAERYIIQERMYRQCYNTFQIFYFCRAFARHGGMSEKMIEFTEAQVVAAPNFKTKDEIKKLRDEKKKKEGE